MNISIFVSKAFYCIPSIRPLPFKLLLLLLSLLRFHSRNLEAALRVRCSFAPPILFLCTELNYFQSHWNICGWLVIVIVVVVVVEAVVVVVVTVVVHFACLAASVKIHGCMIDSQSNAIAVFVLRVLQNRWLKIVSYLFCHSILYYQRQRICCCCVLIHTNKYSIYIVWCIMVMESTWFLSIEKRHSTAEMRNKLEKLLGQPLHSALLSNNNWLQMCVASVEQRARARYMPKYFAPCSHAACLPT